MCLEKVNSQRGKQNLIIEDYLHNFDKIHNDIERWRCRVRTFRGIIYIKFDEYIDFLPHNHPANIKEVEKIRFQNKIKLKALNTKEKADVIISEETKEIEDNEIEAYVKASNIRKLINRERSKQLDFQIKKFNDIPNFLHYDSKGNKFLLHDSGYDDPNRIIIFYSSNKQKYVVKAETWIIDGTFKVSPGDFYQLLTIHIFIFSKSFPAFFVLLKNKKEDTYDNLFKIFKNMLNLSPKIITDFERSLSNSIQKIFINSKTFFCYFHYTQAIWRRVSQSGLTKDYFKNLNFKKVVKMLFTLPLFTNEKN